LEERLGEELSKITFCDAIEHALHIDSGRIDNSRGSSIEDWKKHPYAEIRARVAREKLFFSRLKFASNPVLIGVDIKKSRSVQEKKTESQVFRSASETRCLMRDGPRKNVWPFGRTGYGN
jgi:hypothetical protein